jgi:hypothetical protein
MLQIAAQFADGWSQWGGYDVETEADFYKVTAERCARFDELVVGLGRHPQRIRHSVVCFPPLTPWESSGYFTDMVGRFRSVGVDEFVLYWPGPGDPTAPTSTACSNKSQPKRSRHSALSRPETSASQGHEIHPDQLLMRVQSVRECAAPEQSLAAADTNDRNRHYRAAFAVSCG